MQSPAVQMLVAARRVADYAKELGADSHRLESRPTYDHMGALLADSVLQAGLNYRSVVQPRVAAILANYPEYKYTSHLCGIIESGKSSAFLNWTHDEKVSRFEALILFLRSKEIESSYDLKDYLEHKGNSASELQSVRGVGPKTVDYLSCLVGLDSIAVDRHVRKFAKRVGVMEDDYNFLKAVFCYAADLLLVSRREFDAWIWQREASLNTRQMAFSF
ncbi:hypothetical protein [Paracoccus sp. S4493]|uniref:hypothetical protein n=1 Tax=Paracoccus sp. S4493 TaxID=579490 RepID=UPI000A04195C|nr:hypothetical protein [Paracoccus sp. S4493]